jgi:phosphate transport system ATP-binding protein
MFQQKYVINVSSFSFWYDKTQALKEIDIVIPSNQVTAFIGPSGCGKSTLLRSFNRLNDLLENVDIKGQILFGGQDIYDPHYDVTILRQKIGMVFQKSTPFPMSIFENVAYPLRIAGLKKKKDIREIVEQSLKNAALWQEVCDKLDQNAYSLSGGQQQRLCIARALAGQPEVLLMDEPCSALDPVSTLKIEELISSLKENLSVVIVTHSMSQAKRISDFTVFFYDSQILEAGKTENIFQQPRIKVTDDYINGRYG